MDEFGRLDVLVCNGGISKLCPILKAVPAQAFYAATGNALRALLEGLRRGSADGVLRRTSVPSGVVRTELAHSLDDARVLEQIHRNMDEFGMVPEAVARTIAFEGRITPNGNHTGAKRQIRRSSDTPASASGSSA